MAWYQTKKDHISIRVLAKPNAKKSQITGVDERGIHIHLKAQPEEGKANQELIKFLSKCLDIPKSHVELVRGGKSRFKEVSVLSSEALVEKLELLVKPFVN